MYGIVPPPVNSDHIPRRGLITVTWRPDIEREPGEYRIIHYHGGRWMLARWDGDRTTGAVVWAGASDFATVARGNDDIA